MGSRPDDDDIARNNDLERRLDRDGERERGFLRRDLRRRLTGDDILERGLIGARKSEV